MLYSNWHVPEKIAYSDPCATLTDQIFVSAPSDGTALMKRDGALRTLGRLPRSDG